MCGIAGVFNAPKAAERCVLGLHGNQHRAREFAGIATSDGANLYREVGKGIAREVFAGQKKLNRLHGRYAVGHVRYSTVKRQADDKYRDNIQPVMGHYYGVEFALVHNGNLTNTDELHACLGHRPMKTTIDTEFIVRLIEQQYSGNLVQDLSAVCNLLKGSYSLGILFPDKLVAVLDPSTCHPLSLGQDGESYFLSSETTGFSSMGVDFVRDVEPGEIVVIDTTGVHSYKFAHPRPKKCRFEANYFAHPASLIFGEAGDEYRVRLGRALERHCPALGADIVTPVPDSSNYIAMGYAESGRSGIYRPVIVRSHYGRSFIAATQVQRDEIVALKFSFTPHAIKGKSIVVVDDSIVRGTTLNKVIAELRRYDPKAIHVRSGTPMIKFPCLYGIDTPSKEELVAATHNEADICKMLGADSVQFLPLEVQKGLSPNPDSFCFACMDGKYWHQPNEHS